MAISAVGRKRFAAFGAIIVLDVAVLALAIRVNIFQGFFFIADLFPLSLSITTLTIFLLSVVLDLAAFDFASRPVFEIPLLVVLTFLWLGFNAFSTSRWKYVPMSCSSIPDEYKDVRTWCKNLQALKAMIWIVWVALSTLTLSLLYFVFTEARRGDSRIWRTPLSRYDPSRRNHNSSQFMAEVSSYYRGSSLFNFPFRTSLGNPEKGSMTPESRDFFAPPSPVFKSSVSSSPFSGRAGVGIAGSQSKPGVDVNKGFEMITGDSLENDFLDGPRYGRLR